MSQQVEEVVVRKLDTIDFRIMGLALALENISKSRGLKSRVFCFFEHPDGKIEVVTLENGVDTTKQLSLPTPNAALH